MPHTSILPVVNNRDRFPMDEVFPNAHITIAAIELAHQFWKEKRR